MTNLNKIIDNIKSIFNLKNDKEVADIIGISNSNLSKMKLRESIPYKELINLCEKEGIDINSILYGINDKMSNINYKSEIIDTLEELNNTQLKYIYHITEAEKLKS